jgi:hypothetical protein
MPKRTLNDYFQADLKRFRTGDYSEREFYRVQGFVLAMYSAAEEDLMAIINSEDLHDKDYMVDRVSAALLSDNAILGEKKNIGGEYGFRN